MASLHPTVWLLPIYLVLLLPTQSVGCDDNWTRFDEGCFRIYSHKTNCEIARMTCLYEGGSLASISSLGRLRYLSSQMVYVTADVFWIGLSVDSQGYPKWNNNVSAVLQPWVDISEARGNDTDVFAFNGAKVTRFDCNHPAAFICEQQSSNTTPVPMTCPSRTLTAQHSGKCLWIIDRPLTKIQAMASCSSSGGTVMDLDEIAKEGIDNFRREGFLRIAAEHYWMLLTFNGHEGVWPSGETIPLESPMPWIPGTGECITLQFDFSSDIGFHLHQMDCNLTGYAICQGTADRINLGNQITTSTPAPTYDYECPQGFNWKEDRKTGFCYWETSYETERLSWDDARRYCQSYGGDLASLHSIDEEKIGLSFQYGSLSHPYWIGLKHDLNTDNYAWSDGSPLDYENWAPKQPDTKDLRMRCVHMEASEKSWGVSYCGILSWFICKSPKQINPKIPVPPTPVPLQSCTEDSSDYYLDGFCYETVALSYGWHRAESYCENRGSTLVSIHSEKEIDFLLRLLHANRALNGNRVWIGLNSLGLDGAFNWTDGSVVDFTHWNEDEPNNYHNQEKCCNMYIGNALWNDENCNAVMGFICKRRNDTKSEPIARPTTPPIVGNCKKGWYAFQNKCYLPVGAKKTDWSIWTEASDRCHFHGGYLASAGNAKEQAFLSLLMQNLKSNTWIGLHDTIHSGVYFWTDNSPMYYTNWAPGEPSFFGIKEDCVVMVYDSPESGIWKDEPCEVKLPYICQKDKDPNIKEPWSNKNLRCVFAPDWLKQDDACYQLFVNSPSTWKEAEDICQINGGHVVSVTDYTVQTVVKYLATNTNRSFWIGLKAQENNKFSWINNLPMSLSRWDKNEPENVEKDESCFVSSPLGYWKSSLCATKRPFICQTNIDVPVTPVPEGGSCPVGFSWEDLGSRRFCFLFEMLWSVEWYTANFRCFVIGGHLASIHSLEELNRMKPHFRDRIKSLYIGLTKNHKGGFVWSDGSPVDFVNWEQGEPVNDEDQCVEMRADTLKWRVISCDSKRYSICSIHKEIIPSVTTTAISKSPEADTGALQEHQASLSSGALATIIVCLLAVLAVSLAVFFYLKTLGKSRFRLHSNRDRTMTFENALFNEDTAMEYHNDKNAVFIRN